MPGSSPDCLLLQTERYRDRIFARRSLRLHREIICLFTQRLYVRFQILFPDLHTVSRNRHDTVKCVRIYEQVLVDDSHMSF